MRPATLALMVSALFAAIPATAQEKTCELLISGGQVYDGSGGKPHLADLAIRDGRIVAIGDLDDHAALRTIDARGLAVAPGFVDVHVHADDVARSPEARNFAQMGVTTIISGNCGYSNADLDEAFARLDTAGTGVNFGSLIGHGTIRRAVLGLEQRAPDEAELAQMRTLLREAMRAGAVGLSTGLIYVPGTFADTEELIELARVVAEFDGVYATHIRNENARVVEATEEAIRIGREAGVRVHISHLKASGKTNWGKARDVVATIRRAREAGLRVTGDQYAYDAANTTLDVMFPDEAIADGPRAFARRVTDDADFRAEMEDALLAKMDEVGFGDLSYCRIANAPNNAALCGMTIPEATERRFATTDRRAQARLTLDLVVDARGERINMIYHTMSDDDVATFMAEPWVAIASDAGILSADVKGKPHPRGAGNTARVLAHYVRETRAVSLSDAVRKMTALPAEVFGLEDRGALRVGAWADVTIFDPATVQDHATFDEPTHPPTGIHWVLVNGTPVVQRGEHTDARPGTVLRHSSPH